LTTAPTVPRAIPAPISRITSRCPRWPRPLVSPSPGQPGSGSGTVLREVEQFALGEYATALLQGANLGEDRKHALATRLEGYTGLSAAYWFKANLRVGGGEFSKELQASSGITTGRLDTRYAGPDMDRSARTQATTPSHVHHAGLCERHQPVRTRRPQVRREHDLQTQRARAQLPLEHATCASRRSGMESSSNVMPDLAAAMKHNPKLKVLLMGGYFDLGCTYFGATYEMKHLPFRGTCRTTSATTSFRPATWST